MDRSGSLRPRLGAVLHSAFSVPGGKKQELASFCLEFVEGIGGLRSLPGQLNSIESGSSLFTSQAQRIAPTGTL